MELTFQKAVRMKEAKQLTYRSFPTQGGVPLVPIGVLLSTKVTLHCWREHLGVMLK